MRATLFLLLISFKAFAAHDEPVYICVQEGLRWAPYSFQESNQQEELKGGSIDVIDAVFDDLNMQYQLRPLPWGRVLNELRSESGCEVAWDMSKNTKRKVDILFSEALYEIHVGAFYSKAHNPNMKTLRGALGLLDYKVCGIRGYNYAPIEDLITIYTSRRQQALELLARGRCDIFVGAYEPVFHGERLGYLNVDKQIEFVHGAAFDRAMYVGVSRHSSRANSLLQQINQSLKKLKSTGKFQQIMSQHLGIHDGAFYNR